MAAAIAFYGLISLIPLGVLAVSVLGRVLGSTAASDAEQAAATMLRSVIPLETPGIEDAIRQFPHPRGSWFVEVVSALGLLWAASRLFHTLEDVLTRVWSGHGRGRSVFLRNLIAVAVTAGAALVFLVVMTGTAVAAGLAARAPDFVAQSVLWLVASWLLTMLPVAVAWAMFLLMYKFLPQEPVQWRAAAIGAAMAAVMWEVSRITFAAMVSHSAGYGSLYGSLAGTVVVSVWIYVTATVMLLGAELAVVLQEASGTWKG